MEDTAPQTVKRKLYVKSKLEQKKQRAEEHALQVFEKRNRAFRTLFDTVLQVEGVDDRDIYKILCRNLRKICDAEYAALASYNPETGALKLEAVDGSESIDSLSADNLFGFKPVPITSEMVANFKVDQVMNCSDHKCCLYSIFPKEAMRLTSDSPQGRCYRLSCVRENDLVVAGMIILPPDKRLKLKDIVDTYLNTSALIVERINAVNSLKTTHIELKRHKDSLEEIVIERTTGLRKANERLKQEMVERKQAEETLQQSEEKYRTILESIEDGYFEVDTTGNLTFFNESLCNITGYPEDELMGANNQQYLDRENSKKVYQALNKIYATGIPNKDLEFEIFRKDGAKRYVAASVSLMQDVKDSPIGFRGIVRDITEGVQAKKHIEAAKQEKILAEAANEAKTEFLANMSHEIRTPLNGIVGMAELALDTQLNDNQKNIFHTINTEANALQDVINEVLDFSKIEAGKFDLEEIPFDLRVTIEDVANSFAHRAEQKGLDFISFLAPDVPSQLIGDPVRLRQIMVNLAGNALKFTPEGEIYCKGELAEDLGDRVKIRISVKDSGIGIPKDKQAIIFEGFSQADGSTTRKYGGTGLGTTISKRLAEMMGGEIGVESEEGKGSTFWFTALFGKQEEKERIPAAKDLDLNNLKVLIVDDNQTNRFVLMEYVKSWGCLPVEAVDGKEALIVFRDAVSSENPFDLILTDFQMPEMSGFDLAKEIKKIESLKGVPIIVLTSAGRKGDGRSCREIGINGYLTKPIGKNDLRKAIVSILDLSMERDPDTLPELVTRHSIAEESRNEVQILLAEDYPTNQQVAMRHLQKAGYQVDLAENGREAVDAYERKSYDLILMDIQMPVMGGYEATHEIRKLETGKSKKETGKPSAHPPTHQPISHVPIIAMTAHAIKGYREKCLESGMDDYIAKPLKRTEFLFMVDKWAASNMEHEPEIGPGHQDNNVMEKNAATEEDTLKGRNIPIDFDKAVEEFEGDKEFLMEVIDSFLEKVGTQTETIRQAISNGDSEIVRREAHSIKGGAANLTADELSKVASELENSGKSGMLGESTVILDRLEKEFHRLDTFAKDR